MGCLGVRSDSVFSCVVAASESNLNSTSQVPENSLRLRHRSWILCWQASRRYHTRMREIRSCASVKDKEEIQWQPYSQTFFLVNQHLPRFRRCCRRVRVDHCVRFQYVVLTYVSGDKRIVLSERFCIFPYRQGIWRVPSSPLQTFPSGPRQRTKLTRRLI